MAKKKRETPLMRQYAKIKSRYPDALLLFRMGDFYETFEDDAHTLSDVLGITLTKRSNGKAKEVPLAGFPHHALDAHLPKLVRAGHRVAICEQLEDPKHARTIVKRDVVEVVTPGVAFHDQLLAPKRPTYLAAVHWGQGAERARAGIAFIDASTGAFYAGDVDAERLEETLHAVAPAEVLVDKRQRGRLDAMRDTSFVVTPQEDWCFGADFATETLLRHFKTHSLKGFGVEELGPGLVAAGAALHYLGETQRGRLPHVQRVRRYRTEHYMALDTQTKRNLELLSTLQGDRDGSLVSILDFTRTPMGGRLLRAWLLRPLRDVAAIRRRHDAVAAMLTATTLRDRLSDELARVGDLERLAAKICTGRATPRELVSLRQSLEAVPALQDALADVDADAIAALRAGLAPCDDVVAAIAEALVDEPPASRADGGIIRPGFDAALDELRTMARSGKDYIARLQKEECERTGITSLKVGFNKVFGYYLEVTNAHKARVPEDWIRKQTLVNAERYVTPALKEYEEKVVSAEERMTALEERLFEALRERVAAYTTTLQENAALIARLDVFLAFADAAERYRYVRPEVDDSGRLEIDAGRHPVVERMLPPGEPFIPNSVRLCPDDEQILLITGPNMAGKSVVLRQTGLIVLLAQVGAFVPADRAHVGVVDRIFTRVGASDNLASGESTFLVEMNETANILNNASPHSLILLDEVGRGTSTFDGLSIAWALVEYLHEHPHVAARTLFATHYHELNELAARYGRVRNYRVQVQEHDGRVIFLRSLVPGGADHSYGIEVARMAGLPAPVVARAKEILARLEAQHLVIEGGTEPAHATAATVPDDLEPFQMSLFSPAADPRLEQLREQLDALDVDRMTPIDALLALAELKRTLE